MEAAVMRCVSCVYVLARSLKDLLLNVLPALRYMQVATHKHLATPHTLQLIAALALECLGPVVWAR